MKSLKEQLANKCIHFNGAMNKCCKAGVNYDLVKDKSVSPFKFPCLNQGGKCEKCQFPSEEEVEAKINEIEASSLKSIMAYSRIKSQYQKTKQVKGAVLCECGGNIHYRIQSNGHIWAKCENDACISIIE